MFYASQEKKHGIFFKTAGEINDLYFFVRTENITSVQLTAFGNCSRVQIFVGVGVGFFTIQFAFSQLKQCLPDDSLSKITK